MIDNVFIISFLIAVSWSITPILYKSILSNIPPETFFIYSYIVTTLLVALYIITNWNNIDWHVDKLNKELIGLLVCVILILMVTTYLYYHVLEKNNVHIVTTLTATAPLFTILIAYFYLKEKISMVAWIGMLLVIIGIVLLSHKG